MRLFEKLRENLSRISFLKKKKITVFISIEDKILAGKNNLDPSQYINQKRSLYVEALKIYKPKMLIMYLFCGLFLKKKRGYKRMEKDVLRVQVINWYKNYLNGDIPKYDKHPIIFALISAKPTGKNEDEFGFEESNNL